MNPWNLTPREAEVMSGMTTYGAEKVVADQLGISRKTVMELVYRAKRRIGSRTRLLAVIEWDRWNRANNLQEQQ